MYYFSTSYWINVFENGFRNCLNRLKESTLFYWYRGKKIKLERRRFLEHDMCIHRVECVIWWKKYSTIHHLPAPLLNFIPSSLPFSSECFCSRYRYDNKLYWELLAFFSSETKLLYEDVINIFLSFCFCCCLYILYHLSRSSLITKIK